MQIQTAGHGSPVVPRQHGAIATGCDLRVGEAFAQARNIVIAAASRGTSVARCDGHRLRASTAAALALSRTSCEVPLGNLRGATPVTVEALTQLQADIVVGVPLEEATKGALAALPVHHPRSSECVSPVIAAVLPNDAAPAPVSQPSRGGRAAMTPTTPTRARRRRRRRRRPRKQNKNERGRHRRHAPATTRGGDDADDDPARPTATTAPTTAERTPRAKAPPKAHAPDEPTATTTQTGRRTGHPPTRPGAPGRATGHEQPRPRTPPREPQPARGGRPPHEAVIISPPPVFAPRATTRPRPGAPGGSPGGSGRPTAPPIPSLHGGHGQHLRHRREVAGRQLRRPMSPSRKSAKSRPIEGAWWLGSIPVPQSNDCPRNRLIAYHNSPEPQITRTDIMPWRCVRWRSPDLPSGPCAVARP